jgi:plasmid stability protein
MAQLIVRNLPEELVLALKRRAASHGRSAEEEHRDILRSTLLPEPLTPLKVLLQSMPSVGTDEDFDRERDLGRDVDL